MDKSRNDKFVEDVSKLIYDYEQDTNCMVEDIYISDGMVSVSYFRNKDKGTFTTKYDTMQRDCCRAEFENTKKKIELALTSFYNKTGVWINSFTTILHSNPGRYDMKNPELYITIDDTKISMK